MTLVVHGRKPNVKEKFKSGDCRILFGQYQGLTLREIADQNPAYLDWLTGQDWLYGFIRQHLTAYLSQPQVRAWIDEAVYPELVTTNVFVPGDQCSKLFSLGKPE